MPLLLAAVRLQSFRARGRGAEMYAHPRADYMWAVPPRNYARAYSEQPRGHPHPHGGWGWGSLQTPSPLASVAPIGDILREI